MVQRKLRMVIVINIKLKDGANVHGQNATMDKFLWAVSRQQVPIKIFQNIIVVSVVVQVRKHLLVVFD